MLTGIIIASSLFYAAGWLWAARVMYRSPKVFSSYERYENPDSVALGAAVLAVFWPLWLVLGLVIVIIKGISE